MVTKLDAGALAGSAPGRSGRSGPPSPITRGNPNGPSFRRRSIRRAVRAAIEVDLAKVEARTEAETVGVICWSISSLSARRNEMNSGVTVTVPDLPYGDDPADQAMIQAGITYYQNGCAR